VTELVHRRRRRIGAGVHLSGARCRERQTVDRLHDLPALTDRVARANDMLDLFNFQQRPVAPLVQSELDCSKFK
jgi:hypothetical protein